MSDLKIPNTSPYYSCGWAEYWFEEMIMVYKGVVVWKLVIDYHGSLCRASSLSSGYILRNDNVQAAYDRWLQEKEINDILLNKEKL